jgi:hypothetical protein
MYTLVSMVTLSITVTVVKLCVQLWDISLHNCLTRMAWFPWLPNNLSWSHADWCKFFIHLRSVNVHNFGTVKATRLQIMAHCSLLNGMNSLLNIMKIYLLVKKLLVGDTQADRLVIS